MQTKSNVLKWALIIGMVLVINLFFNYALSLVYKQPDYNVYFPQEQIVESPVNKEDCLKIGGQWIVNPSYVKTKDVSINDLKNSPGYCNATFSKQKQFDNAQKIYDRNVFITLVLLGALCVVFGVLFKKNTLISIAFSLSGVLSFIVASMRYWSSANDLIKVIILAIALGILILLALKKFQDN